MVLETCETDGYQRHPSILMVNNVAAVSFFALPAFGPYVPGVNLSPGSADIGGIWWCPSPPDPIPADEAAVVRDWGWYNLSYAFFGRADIWKPGEASHPEDLTQRQLASDRLLMSDVLQYGHGPGRFSYNHGRHPGVQLDAPPHAFTGLNQVFGDG